MGELGIMDDPPLSNEKNGVDLRRNPARYYLQIAFPNSTKR
jgi:hypothetical protein